MMMMTMMMITPVSVESVVAFGQDAIEVLQQLMHASLL